jgi:hypothetical protein
MFFLRHHFGKRCKPSKNKFAVKIPLMELLTQIPPSTCFDAATNNALTSEWTEDEVLTCASKAPSHSSPGVDGIPYELLQLLLQHPFCIRLFTKVLNTALQHSKFPATWQQSIVILLPKKRRSKSIKKLEAYIFDMCGCKNPH